MGSLFVVATPIGNLNDVSIRALKTLKSVDLILCEDTRVTKKLLIRYEINTPTLSYHQHSKLKKVNYILELLKQDKNLALVSDAGTPGISDPGNKLINFLTTRPGPVAKIIPIPGPSAVTAAVSVSGLPVDKFVFMGFPPHKKRRKKYFQEMVSSKYTVIFYESPYRILRSLRDLSAESNADSPRLASQGRGKYAEVTLKQSASNQFTPLDAKLSNGASQRRFSGRQIVVCRELTKKFETIYRGTIEEVIEQIKRDKIKGEFVVLVRS